MWAAAKLSAQQVHTTTPQQGDAKDIIASKIKYGMEENVSAQQAMIIMLVLAELSVEKIINLLTEFVNVKEVIMSPMVFVLMDVLLDRDGIKCFRDACKLAVVIRSGMKVFADAHQVRGKTVFIA